MAGMNGADGSQDVFDVANWLDRANGREAAPAATGDSVQPPSAYVPRHRADVTADSVA